MERGNKVSTVLNYVSNFIEKYLTVPEIYASDIVEIVIMSVAIYYVVLWFRKSRAWVLLKGIFVLVIFMLVASLFHLTTLLWIFNKTLSAGIIALVIIFQPELRRALEELGRKNVIFKVLKFENGNNESNFSDRSVEEITRATLEMAKAKTGALIVIRQQHDLGQFIETGIKIDGRISSQLLINIFEKNTPLHDGAVIIDENRVVAATCYLPLSDSSSLSKDLGTRHRAGLGISEVSDCIVVIVSEETGSISIAKEGKLIRYADASILKNELIKAQDKEEVKPRRFLKGRGRNEKMSLTNNIGLKFLAVLIALVLWLAIVNVNDPEKTITVSNIPISVTNESAITSRDMVYNVKSEQYLNITVSGKRSIVSNLSAEDFRATASLKELSKVNSIPVDVTTKNASLGRKITIVKQSAQTILVDVENVEEKDFTDLVVEYTGKVADGYVAGLSSMSTDEVTVKAPTSIIDKIKKVAVRCSLDGTNTNISKKCPVILYDKNGKEIKSDEIELSDKKIRVNVNVLRAKQVPISTINKDELGKPADGYVVDDVILSSDSITVYGSEESLDSIESLDIQDDIDVSDAKGDVTQNIDVTGKLPKGLSVSGESTITVKVLIKKLITRTFEYDASEVSLNDLSSDLDVQLVTKKVKVTLQGEEEVISQLTKDDMAISADLGKVKEGTTTVHVDVAVPDNTTLMNNVTIKIKAKAK